MLKRISRGMKTEKGHLVRPEVVRIDEKLENKSKVQVVMRGSAATELKTLLETRGFLFDRLVRTGIGQITLGELDTGEYRRLEASQIRAIFEQPELGMRSIQNAVEKDAEAAARRERRETRAAITPAGAKRPRARVSSGISPRGEGSGPASRPASRPSSRPAPKSAWGDYQPKSARGARPAPGTRGPRAAAFGGEGAAPRARTSRGPMPRAYEGAPEGRAPRGPRSAKPFGEKRGGFSSASRGPRSAKPFGGKSGGFSGTSRGPRKPRTRD
jgi:hypothetical protein